MAQALRTLFPITAFKNAPDPKFVQNLSRRFFFGVPINRTQICQKFVENLKNDNFRTNFQFFDKFLTNLGPVDWNPEKQSSGQILDKFGVRVVFECCKGKKGSQLKPGNRQGCREWSPLTATRLTWQRRVQDMEARQWPRRRSSPHCAADEEVDLETHVQRAPSLPEFAPAGASTLQPEKITYINVCFRNEFPERNNIVVTLILFFRN